MRSTTRRRTDIQILRGVAVLGVILFHTSEEVFKNGQLGVDVFFVISGFVVAPLIIELIKSDTPKQFAMNLKIFLRNRLFRLAPALFVMLALTSLIIIAFSSVSDLGRISRQGIYTFFLAGNLGAYKFAGDYFAPSPNPLIHTWSLAVEEQFYLIIPVLLGSFHLFLIACRKYINSVFVPFLTLISFALFWSPGLLGNFYGRFGISEPAWASFYFPTSRAWEFLVGYLLFVGTGGSDSEKRIILRYSYLRLFSLITSLLVPFKIHSNFLTVSVVMLTCIVIYKRDLEVFNSFFRRIFVWMGDRSYSLYLFHMPLLYIPRYSPLYAEIGVPKFLGILLSLLSTFVIANFVYTSIENHFRIVRSDSTHKPLRLNRKAGQLLVMGIIPITVFSTLILGEKNKFWGLDRNLDVPQYAGFLDPNCQRDTRDGPPCQYGNKTNANTVLLIGDSHAGQFSQAVVDAANSTKWNSVIWTHSACRFELYENVPSWCKAVNYEVLKYIKKTAPDVVILSQSNGVNRDVSSSIKSISRLTAASKKLVIVDETPRYIDTRFMNPGSLLQKPYLPPKYRDMNIALESYVVNARKIYSSRQLQGVVILNVNHNFCDATRCYRWKDGSWLYRDLNHLSIAGAKLTLGDFIKVLRANQSSDGVMEFAHNSLEPKRPI